MPASVHVLLAGWHPEVQAMLTRMLRLILPATSLTLANTYDAVLAAEAAQPIDLMLIHKGSSLPECIEMLQTLRAQGCTVPILMFHWDAVEVERAIMAGANAGLLLPFSFSALRQQIDALLLNKCIA